MECPNCTDCPDCIEVTLKSLGSSCQGEACADFNGVYQLGQVGNTCVWTYLSGSFRLSIECELGNWWLWVEYNDHNCAVWSYPLHGAPNCPPVDDCIWIWAYGDCSEGVATTDSCPT